MMRQQIFQDTNTLYKTAADLIFSLAEKAVFSKGKFVIALSGGQTPEQLYKILSEDPFREKLPWENTFVFWGDERFVPVDDKRNNASCANNILLNKVPVPAKNIFRIPVDGAPGEAAKEYQKTVENFFGENKICFDLILLGLGENGHTASLFPGTSLIPDKKAEIKEVYVAEEKMFRITMTAPMINQANNILFLVTGEKKATILKNVLSNNYDPEKYPAQLIHPINGDLIWFIDQEAAKKLEL
ncbi:MAG: 6-phosphogluconolactonase [Bacteroidia bacterium]